MSRCKVQAAFLTGSVGFWEIACSGTEKRKRIDQLAATEIAELSRSEDSKNRNGYAKNQGEVSKWDSENNWAQWEVGGVMCFCKRRKGFEIDKAKLQREYGWGWTHFISFLIWAERRSHLYPKQLSTLLGIDVPLLACFRGQDYLPWFEIWRMKDESWKAKGERRVDE